MPRSVRGMSFFDKISDVAKQAKKAIEDAGVSEQIDDAVEQAKQAFEESGVADQISEVVDDVKQTVTESGDYDKVRDAVTGGSASASAMDAAAAPSSSGSDWSSHVPDGIVDPVSLLTIDEVADVTGQPFTVQNRHREDEWIGVIFTPAPGAGSGYFELRIAKAYDGEPYDPDGMWGFLTTEVEPREPAPRVHSSAFRSAPDTVFFRVGDTIGHTVANWDEDPTNACDELARRAIARLG